MRSTKQDMERLIALHPYTNPASVPVEYTLGDRHYCGFPAEFHPVAETRRVDANLYETTVTAHTPEGLELRAVCQSFLDFPVVDWVMYVTNRGSDNSPVLSDWHITTTYSGQSPVLAHSNGDTCGEDGYTWFDTVPEDGGTLTIQPDRDGTSCKGAFPYMRLRFSDWGVNVAVGWTGTWRVDVLRTGDAVTLRAGQAAFASYLKPGETVRTPRMTYEAYTGGEDRARNLWRSFYLAHILPRENGAPLPSKLILHTWMIDGLPEFCGVTEENQKRAIDAYRAGGLVPDIWWIDAGWYPCDNNWPTTGNWYPHPEHLPNGLAPIGEKCDREGIQLLVWFEPERVILDHRPPEMPERFVLKRRVEQDGKSWIDAQGLLNLGDPECRKWLTNHVNRLIQEGHIAIYRQDFNFDPLPYWQQADAPDRIGMTENQHIQGYLAYWDALLEANPGLIIDSCASGGRRNDLETMRRSVTMHPTDYGYGDPPIKQRFYNALFAWIPYFRALSVIWKEENGKYLLNEPDPRGLDNYALHNGLGPMFNSGVFCDDPQELLDRVRTFADTVWHPAAPYMMEGDYYPLTETRCSVHDWCAYAFFDPKKESGFIHLIRNPYAEAETFTTHLSPLDPACTYRFTNPETGEQFDTAGNAALTFALPARSGTIWFFAPKK